MNDEKLTGKILRSKYGILGWSIIEIVGLIMVVAAVATVIYQFV